MSDTALPHRRRNLLTGEWVLVSPQRTARPWQGHVDAAPQGGSVDYDPHCYLCPRNARAAGARNPDYRGPYAFDNDYPALQDAAGFDDGGGPFFRAEAEPGVCRVICFSDRHERHLVDMSVDEITAVLRFIARECNVLDARPDVGYVQAFENRGAMMGSSNPHPHGQVWATRSIPNEPARELAQQLDYWRANGRSLLPDYLRAELDAGERIVAANDQAVSLVPYWATWPFETLLMPTEPAGTLDEMADVALHGFAGILKATLTACDRLFGVPMPYSMGFHPRPSDGNDYKAWQFHAHVYPPLLRSATVRKHMVGFEMLAMPQRDLTPELAALRLRSAGNS